MKYKIIAVLGCIALFLSPYAAYAEETESTEETEEAAEEYADSDEDGVRDCVPGDEVTDEMLEEGWVIMSDGYGYPPEYFDEGDVGATSATVASFSDEDSLYNVTFKTIVPSGTTETMELYFAEMSSYLEYGIELYASEDYVTTVKLPAGNYYFTSGGPIGDYYGVYTVSDPVSFTVAESVTNYVEVTISEKSSLGFTEDEEEEEESGTLTEEESSSFSIPVIVIGILFVLAGILVLYIALKRVQKH